MFYASDVKQYFYCKRLIYFKKVAPVEFKKTDPMKMGEIYHEVVTKLEERRTLREYDLRSASRQFHYRVYSRDLNLSGMLDLLLITDDGRYIPVDFKYSSGEIFSHLRYQLVAYALLLERCFDTIVDFGFLYFLPAKKVVPIDITEKDKSDVLFALQEMDKLVSREILPSYDSSPVKCYDCEYRRFCNDVF